MKSRQENEKPKRETSRINEQREKKKKKRRKKIIIE